MLNRTFPVYKFARTNTTGEQREQIGQEFYEAVLAKTEEERDMEFLDLYHSIETYFTIREREGLDVDALIQQVIEKNRVRGYYELSECRCRRCGSRFEGLRGYDNLCNNCLKPFEEGNTDA